MAVSFYLGACTQGKEHRYSIRDISLNLNRRVLEVFIKFLRPNQTQVYTGEPIFLGFSFGLVISCKDDDMRTDYNCEFTHKL